jgi:hypothetical protein
MNEPHAAVFTLMAMFLFFGDINAMFGPSPGAEKWFHSYVASIQGLVSI